MCYTFAHNSLFIAKHQTAAPVNSVPPSLGLCDVHRLKKDASKLNTRYGTTDDESYKVWPLIYTRLVRETE